MAVYSHCIWRPVSLGGRPSDGLGLEGVDAPLPVSRDPLVDPRARKPQRLDHALRTLPRLHLLHGADPDGFQRLVAQRSPVDPLHTGRIILLTY